MSDLNRLVQLRCLTLMKVDLIVQPALGIMFHNLSRLESLNLIECRILTLEEELSRDLQSLSVIKCHAIEEFSMLDSFPVPLTFLRFMEFSGPHLHCSCDNAWLDNWARRQQHVQVIFWLEGELEMTCKNENGIQNLRRYSEAHCSLDVRFVLFICTSLDLLLSILVVLPHQLAGDHLLAFCHIAHS